MPARPGRDSVPIRLGSSFNPGIALAHYRIIPHNVLLARELSRVVKAYRLSDPGWTRVFGQGEYTIQQANYYRQHLWIYACINAIAQNIGGVPFRIYRGEQERPVTDEKNEVYRLFRDVNPQLSRYQLFEGTCVFLYGWGEAFWVLEKRGMRSVQEIWMFRPDNFKHVVKNGELVGWVYETGRKRVPLDREEVIHFKLFNPYDDVRGLNPMQVAKLTVEQDYFAQRFNWRFFKEDATPGLALTTEQKLTEDQYERIVTEWQQKYGGVAKSHQIAILDGGLKFDKMPVTQKDMDFAGLRKMSREEICAIFKVPPAEVGILEYSRAYANTRSQDKGFWQKTLIPRMHYFEDVLNTNFFPVHFPGYKGYFDTSVVEALQEDLKEKSETAFNFFRMGYPVNAINELLDIGLPEIEGGNIGYLPQTYVPVTSLRKVGKSLVQRPHDRSRTIDTGPEPGNGQIGDKNPVPTTSSSTGPFVSVGRLRASRILEIKDRYANDLRVELETAKERLRDWMKEAPFPVLGARETSTTGRKGYAPEVIEEIFQDWIEAWQEHGIRYLTEAFEYGLEEARELMGDLMTSETYRETLLGKVLSKNNGYVQKRIDRILARLAEELSEIGWQGAAAADVAVNLIERNGFRAETFANFVLTAAHESFVAEGAVRGYSGIWHITGDGDECPTCEQMAAQNPWVLEMMPTYPGDDTICNGRCRCYVEIIKPEQGG